ncbi:MAG: LysR substrate-binding domain-containing protein, partial [Rhodospirillaceae bacterium]
AQMPPDHPLAAKAPELALVDALDYPWIMGDENLSILPVLEPTLRELGRTAPRIVNTNSFELMKKLTLRGIGISFQSVFGFEDDLAAGRLVHVPVAHNGPISRDLSVQIRKGRALTASIRVFINIVVQELDRRAGFDPGA